MLAYDDMQRIPFCLLTMLGCTSDDSDEESEGEELRKAATAYTAASRRPKASQPEVIVLDDSSDDEQPPARPPQPVARAASQLANIASAFNSAGGAQRPASQPNEAAMSAASPSFNWGAAVANRQLPASFQAGASAATQASNGPLRIKLPTRQPERRPHSQQQLSSQLPTQPSANGTLGPMHHPADPTTSAGRLAAAVDMRPSAARQGQQTSLGKRKHLELDGQYGAYSQAAAQASGMSMVDHVQQAMHRASGNRLPPYPHTSISYSARAPSSSSGLMPPAASNAASAHGQYPSSPEYWRQQQQQMGSPAYGQPAVGSPPYGSSMVTSPPYSPPVDARYGNGSIGGRQPTIHEREAEEAAVLRSLQQQANFEPGPSYWGSEPLTDGEILPYMSMQSSIVLQHM